MVIFFLSLYRCERTVVLDLCGQDDGDQMLGNLYYCGNMSLLRTLVVAGRRASNLHPRGWINVNCDSDNVWEKKLYFT